MFVSEKSSTLNARKHLKLDNLINLLYCNLEHLPRVMTDECSTCGSNAALIKGGNSANLDLINNAGKLARNLLRSKGVG